MGVVDHIDRQIMDALARDGRTPFTVLARDLNVAEATVRSRVRRLQDEGLLNIVALCNPLSLGHQAVRLLIRVRDLTPRAVARILMDVAAVNYVALTVGGRDLYVEATCRDQEQLVGLLDDIRMMPGVSSVETLVLLKLFKDYSWTGLGSSAGRGSVREG
jgi:Lrp/AsnC family transcriptional regulator, regulator for asnA, asnC and gidA